MAAIFEATEGRMLPEAARTVNAERWLMRATQKFFGTALVISAFGLWLHPGAALEPELLLFKLAVSIFFALVGFGLLRSGRSEKCVEVEIDTNGRSVRLVRVKNGATRLVEAIPFSELGEVERYGQMLRLWDQQGNLVAEVPMTNPAHAARILAAFGCQK